MANHQKAPLIILCIDSGDPDLIEMWVKQGYLPTIKSIMDRGFWGRPEGPDTVSEHGLMLAMMSGVSRDRHHYYHWRPLKPGTYDLQLANLREIPFQPFWGQFSDGRKSVAIIDVPETYPIPGLKGLQLANWKPHNPRIELCTEPSALLQELQQKFPPAPLVDEELNSNPDNDRKILRGLKAQIREKGEMIRYLLKKDDFDLIVTNFYDVHVAGHQFWKYSPELISTEHSPKKTIADLAHGTRDIYQALDAELAAILAELPANANIFIVSNVGVQADFPTIKLNESFCRALGYEVLLPGGSTNSGGFSPLNLARKIIPEEWRVAISKRLLSRKTREKLLTQQFRSQTDWSKTTVFPIPVFYTGFLRVNLQGREPMGIVKPGPEYHQLLEQVTADLKALIEPKSGKPAVKHVWKTVDVFGGQPPEHLPDIFIEWTPLPYFKERVIHLRAGEIRQKKAEFFRDTHHTHIGFVAGAGPDIQKLGKLAGIPVTQLAPTFLQLMGEPQPDYMRDTPLPVTQHRTSEVKVLD